MLYLCILLVTSGLAIAAFGLIRWRSGEWTSVLMGSYLALFGAHLGVPERFSSLRTALLVAASVPALVVLATFRARCWRSVKVELLLLAAIAVCVVILLPASDPSGTAFRLIWATVAVLSVTTVTRIIMMILRKVP